MKPHAIIYISSSLQDLGALRPQGYNGHDIDFNDKTLTINETKNQQVTRSPLI